MLREIMANNGLDLPDVISVQFSATRDLTAAYPAEAARAMGLTEAGLCCYQEMNVPGSTPMCIRALVNAESEKPQNEMRHAYLRGAALLRPDLRAKRGITIDGPGGSGKSTAARRAAAMLGFIYVDTGAMYRAAALYCTERGVSPEDDGVVKALLDMDMELKYINGAQRTFLNGADVTERLRAQDIAEASSKIAAVACVREKLVAMQRRIAEKNDVVMDGRDIGTHVLPGARLKIYLDARAEIRAKRRVNELQQKGEDVDYDDVLAEIKKRDERDMNRAHSPLAMAADAVYIDAGDMNAEAVPDKIVELYRKTEIQN